MSTGSFALSYVPGGSLITKYMIEALEPRLLLSGGKFDLTFGDHGAAHGELFARRNRQCRRPSDLAADTDLFRLTGS